MTRHRLPSTFVMILKVIDYASKDYSEMNDDVLIFSSNIKCEVSK